MAGLVTLPILGPLLAAAMMLTFRGSRLRQTGFAIFGASTGLLASFVLLLKVVRHGTLVAQIGAWPAPFGISFVADRLSVLMSLVAGVLVGACVAYSLLETQIKRGALGLHPFLLVLLAGANGAFLTGDLFNLYVWFEVLLINSFSLLVLGGNRAQLRGAVPYLTMSLVASALMLSAVGLIYGISGTLNMAELARRVGTVQLPHYFTTAAIVFLSALGVKAAVFPLFFWLPKAYPTVPVAISAAFSGLLTKVAVYAMIRFAALFLGPSMDELRQPLLVVAAITMVTGVLGAASQNELRRILSFHIISQIGYMIMGLALFTPLAITGAIYFMIHNIFAKSNLFLISGVVGRVGGSFELKSLGGVYRKDPHLSLLFIVSAFSLAGLPPLSGFWGKLVLARSGLESKEYVVVAISLLVGILTLFSMTKIWLQVFWKPAPGKKTGEQAAPGGEKRNAAILTPVLALAAITIGLGIFVEPIIRYLGAATNDFLDPRIYISAVLGRGGSGR